LENGEVEVMGSSDSEIPRTSSPRRLKKQEAREALPENLRPTYDKLCEETHYWSQYYYGSTLISYSIIKELVEDGWTKIRRTM
jgi:hypothetical protein